MLYNRQYQGIECLFTGRQSKWVQLIKVQKKQLPGVPKLHVQVNNHLSQSVVSGLGHGQFSTDPTADGFYDWNNPMLTLFTRDMTPEILALQPVIVFERYIPHARNSNKSGVRNRSVKRWVVPGNSANNGLNFHGGSSNTDRAGALYFGTVNPTVTGQEVDNDSFIVTSDGTPTGTIISFWKFDEETLTWVIVPSGDLNNDRVLYTGNTTIPTLAPPKGVDTAVLSNGTRYDWDGTVWVVQPGAIFDSTVDFNTANPNTGGTVFTPNTPTSTTVLYVSTIDGSQWTYNGATYVTAPVSSDWRITGNAGTVQATNFVGTTDNVGLSLRTNNTIRQTITNSGESINVGAALGVYGDLGTWDGTRWSGVRGNSGTSNAPAVTGINTVAGGVSAYFNQRVGIGTTAPTSNIHINGSEAGSITNVIATTTTWSIPNTIDTVVINNWATAITLTMPTKVAGKVITLMRGIGSTWGIIVNPWWWQIEALANTLWATTSLAASGAVWQNVMFMSDGTNWLRKNNG